MVSSIEKRIRDQLPHGASLDALVLGREEFLDDRLAHCFAQTAKWFRKFERDAQQVQSASRLQDAVGSPRRVGAPPRP